MKKLGKRKMITIFKQYFPGEYNSDVADYAALPDWERLSCHGCKVSHEKYFGVDSFVCTSSDGGILAIPVSECPICV